MSTRFGLRTITGKLLVAFLAVFIPLAASYYVAYREYRHTSLTLARDRQAAVTRAAASAVQDLCTDVVEELRIANAALNGHENDGVAWHLFKALSTEGKECVAAGIFDLGANSVESYPPLKPEEYKAVLVQSDIRAGPSISSVGTIGNNSVFTISTPIATSDDSPKVTFAAIATSAVHQAISNAVGESYSVMVADQEGNSICAVGDSIPRHHLARLLSIKPPPNGGSMEFEADDSALGCMATAPISGWRIVVISPESSAAPFAGSTAALVACFVLAAVLMSVVTGRHIASPIRKLSRAAAAVAVGDFRRRVHIKTGDELESLAESFNRMAASLEEHERELHMKTRVQQSLLEVTRTITGSLELEKVASSIADVLKQQFQARQATIFRRDETTGRMHPVLPPDGESELVSESMIRLAEHAFDSPTALSLPAGVVYPGGEAGDGSVIALPLVVGNRTVGVLTATFHEQNGLDPEMRDRVDLLESFGSIAAVAVHNADIHGRTEEFMKMLDSLRRVVSAISSSLDLNQVVHSLVRTTSEVMDAKGCALLLADRNGRLSVAEAHNLSRQFLDKLNIEPGERWTGVSFAEKRPISRSDVAAETDLRLRIYAEKEGLHGFISAPLIVGTEAIGAINVWMDHPHEARAMEVDLLTSIASHAAVVIANSKLFSKEYQIAKTLQSSLMGVVPDKLGRMSFGYKYLPVLDEAEVGGDIYDVIDLPNGKIALIVADVSGKGIQAAMHTAMIRHMGRAFLFQWPDSPATALDLLNRALCNFVGGQAFVTVFYAIIDPQTGRMVYANAGHPPAIALTNSGKQQVLFYRTGMPAGYSEESTYEERSVTLAPGDVLLLYTDGIIEAKRDGRMLALEGLQDILFRNASLDPKSLVEIVCRETSEYANSDQRDDIAVVAAALGPD